MKRFLPLFLLVSTLFGQTTTITMKLTFPSGVLGDILTHWMDQHGSPIATLASPVGVNDTSITTVTAVTLPLGETVLIDSEPMSVTSAVSNSTTIPVTRNIPGITPTTHVVATNVSTLQYPDMLSMMAAEVFKSWANGIVVNLANQGRSAVIGQMTGTFTVGQ